MMASLWSFHPFILILLLKYSNPACFDWGALFEEYAREDWCTLPRLGWPENHCLLAIVQFLGVIILMGYSLVDPTHVHAHGLNGIAGCTHELALAVLH
jgi:hypothetical protein